MTNLDDIINTLINKPEVYCLENDPFDAYLEKHGMSSNPFADKIIDNRMYINKDEKVCKRIMRALRHNQSSLMILSGPTGSGKSEVADFIVRMLPEKYVFWYNQICGQTSSQLASSIIRDLDSDYMSQLNESDMKRIIDIYGEVLNALLKHGKKLFCIFDQGEHFSKDGFELVINSTNPHYIDQRAFTGLILAVPRFEKHMDKWIEEYDTTLKRALIREYVKPFNCAQSLEYIARGLAVSRKRNFHDLMKKQEFGPFDNDAIMSLIEIGKGHPSTLCSLSYLSLELAALTSPDSAITEEIINEAWKKFPNKELHKEAVAWYKSKELYTEG
ncbi:MAG: ATP-binding protein [Candidatus Methanoperedens sp.]|nr:ATP-binding protein [Candidatus Methanoperedens sp.]